jgi:hypothetical protein
MICRECGRAWPDEDDECPDCTYRAHYRPLRELGNVLTMLLAFTVLAMVALLALRASGTNYPPLGTAVFLGFLVTVVVFVVWFRRARINADGSDWRQRRAAGWTIWGWIVPIASLFVPFQLMGDIWRAGLADDERHRVAVLPAAWWTTWLIGTIASPVQSGGSSGFRIGFTLGGGSDLRLGALVASGMLLIAVVQKVSKGPLGWES